MIRRVPRFALTLSGIGIALAATLSAVSGAPALAFQAGIVPKVEEAKCPDEARAIERRVRCGYVVVPLDRANPDAEKIRIYFELYPRDDRSRPPISTVLTIEGGPGFPTTADRDTRAEVWRPVNLVPSFARSLEDMRPAEPAAGDRSRRRDRQLAAATAATVADVVARWWVNYDATNVGLHGGRWSYEGDDPVVFDLDAVEFVPGVKVSGTVRWGATTVTARATARAPDAAKADLRISWSTREQRAEASLTGDVGGRRLSASMPAP